MFRSPRQTLLVEVGYLLAGENLPPGGLGAPPRTAEESPDEGGAFDHGGGGAQPA
jgi:hypothetical protein